MASNRPALTVVPATGAGLARPQMQPLYDSCIMTHAAPTTILRFFTVPKGNVIQGGLVNKTEWHTNMNQAGTLSQPNAFECAGILVEPEPGCVVAQHLSLFRNGVFKFYFGDNEQIVLPTSQMPQGVATISAVTTLAVQGHWSRAMYDMRIRGGMFMIKPTESFHAEIHFPSGVLAAPYADMLVRVWLLGYFHRQL